MVENLDKTIQDLQPFEGSHSQNHDDVDQKNTKKSILQVFQFVESSQDEAEEGLTEKVVGRVNCGDILPFEEMEVFGEEGIGADQTQHACQK